MPRRVVKEESNPCSEGGQHDFGERVTAFHWFTAIICCPIYIPLALCNVGATPIPCKSCNAVEHEDDNGNPRCKKCDLSAEESLRLREYEAAEGRQTYSMRYE